MSDAYKCGRCEEFQEGTPYHRRYKKLLDYGLAGWSNTETVETVELCSGCKDEADELVSQILRGETDE